MFAKTRAVAQKFGSKAAAGAALALAGGTAMAQEAGSAGAQVLTKAQEGLTQGEAIAVAVVVGLFSIWAIKLLWRSK